MKALPLTSLINLLIVVLLFVNTFLVGKARVKYTIKAPQISGHEDFERMYRIQMNTIESFILFFPALWIYAAFVGDAGASVTGAIWLVGRVWYTLAYKTNPAKRGPGFALSMFAAIGAWLGGLYGVVMSLVH
jgi:glutathione S-transferase